MQSDIRLCRNFGGSSWAVMLELLSSKCRERLRSRATVHDEPRFMPFAVSPQLVAWLRSRCRLIRPDFKLDPSHFLKRGKEFGTHDKPKMLVVLLSRIAC
jgi:hypothetical protein